LSTESLPIQHDIDEDHQRSEISAPHYELLNGIQSLFRILVYGFLFFCFRVVLNHHSSQLQSNRMKKIKVFKLHLD